MSKSKLATLGVLFVAFVWGVEFVLIHNAIAELQPHSFNIARFGVASLFIGICLLFSRLPGTFSRRMFKHGFLLGLLLFLGFACQTYGLLYTTVSNCGFITSLSVVLVPVFAFMLLAERPRFFTLAGVVVASAGLYLLTSAGDAPFNQGDFLTLIGAAMFALHIVYTGKYSRDYEVLRLTLVQLTTVTVLSFVSASITEDWQLLLDVRVMGNSQVLVAILVSALLGTGIAILLQTLAQGHLTSTRVALIYSLEPVFAALTAFIVLNEQLPPVAGIGAVFILFGIVLAELPTVRNKRLIPLEEVNDV